METETVTACLRRGRFLILVDGCLTGSFAAVLMGPHPEPYGTGPYGAPEVFRRWHR